MHSLPNCSAHMPLMQSPALTRYSPFLHDAARDSTRSTEGWPRPEQVSCGATADLELIAVARRAVGEIFEVRYLGIQANPSFKNTDLGSLGPLVLEAEKQFALESDRRDRIRVALHMSLASASVALEVAAALMSTDVELSTTAHTDAMIKLAEDALGASDTARHAAMVLSGEEVPENDVFFAETNF